MRRVGVGAKSARRRFSCSASRARNGRRRFSCSADRARTFGPVTTRSALAQMFAPPAAAGSCTLRARTPPATAQPRPQNRCAPCRHAVARPACARAAPHSRVADRRDPRAPPGHVPAAAARSLRARDYAVSPTRELARCRTTVPGLCARACAVPDYGVPCSARACAVPDYGARARGASSCGAGLRCRAVFAPRAVVRPV